MFISLRFNSWIQYGIVDKKLCTLSWLFLEGMRKSLIIMKFVKHVAKLCMHDGWVYLSRIVNYDLTYFVLYS